jgi:hypothetical protein
VRTNVERTGSLEARRPVRRGYQLPTVTELPRRWDPLREAEVVVRDAA